MKHARPIVLYPDTVLRERCRELGGASAETRELGACLRASLDVAGGIGLAAPQIGEAVRIALVRADPATRSGGALIMINPVIVSHSETRTFLLEGCLSLPGRRLPIERPDRVTVEYISETGRPRSIDLEGLAAKCAQHEIDHLDGVLILDRTANLAPQAVTASIFPTIGATVRATASHFPRSR